MIVTGWDVQVLQRIVEEEMVESALQVEKGEISGHEEGYDAREEEATIGEIEVKLGLEERMIGTIVSLNFI